VRRWIEGQMAIPTGRPLGALRDWRDAGLDTPIAVPAGETDPIEQLGVIGAELAPWWRSRP
jgi:hypothetical protein